MFIAESSIFDRNAEKLNVIYKFVRKKKIKEFQGVRSHHFEIVRSKCNRFCAASRIFILFILEDLFVVNMV